MENFDTIVPADVNVRAISVAKGDSANVAVSSLVASPAEPVAGQETTVLCRVRNLSGEARRTTLSLDAGGSNQSRPVDLPAWGAAEAAFTVRCPTAGLLTLTAALEDDAFPGDDRCHAVLRVRESLRMAVAAPAASPELKTARMLADALPWLDFIDCPDPGNPPPCDLLLVSILERRRSGKLRALATQGTTLIVFPSPGISAKALADVTGTSAEAADGILTLETRPEGWQAMPVEGKAAFALFASGEFGNPLAGVSRQRLRLPASITGKGELLGRFADGTPALLAYPTASAPIVLSNLSLDSATSDWTSRSTFLPGFAELILHTRPKVAADPFTLEPGSFPAWSPADPSQAATLTLADPAGKPVPLETNARTGLAFIPTRRAGDLLVADFRQAVHHTVVNFPESESDLRVLPELPTFGKGDQPRESLARAAALDHGLPLWPWLVALALLVLLVEPLITAPSSPKSS